MCSACPLSIDLDEANADFCELVEQNCPEGEQCTIRKKYPECKVSGPEQLEEDESCTVGECAKGLVCLNYESGPMCTSFCAEYGYGCPEGKYCAIGLESNRNIRLCFPIACDVHSDDCGEAKTCGLFTGMSGELVTVCIGAGEKTVGEDCEIFDCVAGTVCYGTNENTKTCRRVCEIADDCDSESDFSSCSGKVDGLTISYCSE